MLYRFFNLLINSYFKIFELKEIMPMSETTNTNMTTTKARHKKIYKPKSYKVTDEYLLYKIADAGLVFPHLHGVNRDKDGNKVFHFDRVDEIKSMIYAYNQSGYAQ